MCNYYIFNSSNAKSLDGKNIAAYSVALARLRKKVWPLYQRTPFRNKISENDKCLIYISGSSGVFTQHFISNANIKGLKISGIDKLNEDEYMTYGVPSMYLNLENIAIYKNPINIRDYVNKLAFIGNKDNWGVYMQGGVRKISNEDYNLLIDGQ